MFTRRIGYQDLPGPVHAWVESALGGAVVEHLPQTGGFSPGAAERLRLADGRRAFCKAVHPSQNEGSAALYRTEARVNALLPAGVPAPRMLATTELDGWVVLLFEDVDGRQPEIPWLLPDFEATLDALGAVGAVDASALDLPAASEMLGSDYAGFTRLIHDPDPDLDPWIAAHLPELDRLALDALPRSDGDRLCVVDARSDNTLLADGRAWILDWPWAARGTAHLDACLLTATAYGQGATFDPGEVTDAWLAARGVSPQVLTDALLGAMAFLADAGRRPAPPGLEELGTFRRRFRDALIPVMARRLALD